MLNCCQTSIEWRCCTNDLCWSVTYLFHIKHLQLEWWLGGIHRYCLLSNLSSFYHMQWTAEGSIFGTVRLRVFLFVYEISRGTTERICAKFRRKTCLVLRSDELECQGQRLKVNVTRDNKKASIRWQDRAPPISGYWSTCEPNAG